LIRGLNIKVIFIKMSQVQVVSKGMRWTQDAANKAAQNHQYIKIGTKPGHLLLSGAPGRWKKPETAGDVYVPSLRVAGNPAMIRQLFIGLGVPAGTIDQHLANAYTAQNYQGAMKANFDREVAAYKAYKSSKDAEKKDSGGPSVNLSQLQYFVDQLQSASTVARTTTGSPRAASPGGRATRVKALATRLADATSKGKVLDVSKYDTAKGTGIKMIARPGPNSKKIGVPGLDIVSSDAGLYAAAVRQLGAQYEPFINQYNSMVAQKTAVVVPPQMAAPTLPAASPTAAVPTFPVGGASPLTGGVALPTVPGAGTLPATTLPIGSPVGSPGM
jgi:hypothetical protein